MYCASKIINSTGLILDIIGIIILFVPDYKAVDKNIFAIKPIGGEGPEVYKAKKRMSTMGIALIVLGFILQLVSNWL